MVVSGSVSLVFLNSFFHNVFGDHGRDSSIRFGLVLM